MYVSCVVLLCKIRDEGKCCVVARSEVSAGQILKLYSWILLHFWQRPDRFFLNWMEQQASYIVSPSLMMKICDHNCSDDAGFYKDFVVLLWEKLLKNPFYGRYTTTLQTNHPPYGLPLPPPPQVFLDANETIVVRHQDSKTHMVFFR